MTHFVVLVVGADVDKQMAKFDENMEVPRYQEFYSDEDVALMSENYHITDLNKLADKMEAWCGAKGGVEDGKLFKWSTYNPDSKWDWYEIGGRWEGNFLLKGSGKKSDQAKLKDIDFEKMHIVAMQEAEKEWKHMKSVLGDLPFPPKWAEVLEKYGATDVVKNRDAAAAEYNSNPSVEVLKKADLLPFLHDFCDVYATTLKEHVQQARAQVVVPYAVVMNGEWNAKGDMGWWGMSSDKLTQAQWNEKVAELYATLPEDTMLTMLDCHI